MIRFRGNPLIYLISIFLLVLGSTIFGCASVNQYNPKENMVFIPDGSFTMGFKIDNNFEISKLGWDYINILKFV